MIIVFTVFLRQENFRKIATILVAFWNKHTVNGEINILIEHGTVVFVERIECLITEAEWQTAAKKSITMKSN